MKINVFRKQVCEFCVFYLWLELQISEAKVSFVWSHVWFAALYH